MSTPAIADVTLIDLALAGKPAMARRLVSRLQPAIARRVERVLRRLTPTWLHDGPDIVQSVWVVLWKEDGRQLRAFAPIRGVSLEAYVAMIAEREVRNHIARVCAAKRCSGPRITLTDEVVAGLRSTEACPEETLMAADLAGALFERLEARLPCRGQAVLRTCVGQEETPESTARVLEMPSQQVYNWMHRIRNASRLYLTTQAA